MIEKNFESARSCLFVIYQYLHQADKFDSVYQQITLGLHYEVLFSLSKNSLMSDTRLAVDKQQQIYSEKKARHNLK